MALLLGNCHTILLTGILNASNKSMLTVRLPFEDIKTNLWQICLSEISVEYKSDCNIICGVSCNFISDICFNEQMQVINAHPIIAQVLFKGMTNDKQIVRFDKTWFYLTSAQAELQLNFHLLSEGKVSKQNVPINCSIYATMLLQRVK